jgi:hypothetical protein
MASTGQSILDFCEDLLPELQLQPGEGDVTKGLRLANAAQDYFEIIAADYPDFAGGVVGVIATVGAQESSPIPAGVLRIDRLQFLDDALQLPAWDLVNYKKVGGHAPTRYWPYNISSTSILGKPRAYWSSGNTIYWDPRPDAAHNVRYYGFAHQPDITAGGVFAYDDSVVLPLATFVCRVAKSGQDDDPSDLIALAKDLFKPCIDALTNYNRDTATGFEYRYAHRS